LSDFEQVPDLADAEAPSVTPASVTPASAPPAPAEPGTPVASALRELDTLGDRELGEHPDVYQRIHAELQSALTAIDNA
jgi:hypothetical protein